MVAADIDAVSFHSSHPVIELLEEQEKELTHRLLPVSKIGINA